MPTQPLSYKKRFSTDISMDKITFLNDKTIDGEIYSYLLSKSIVETQPDGTKRTFCPKTEVNMKQLAEKQVFGNITRQTIANRIKRLAGDGTDMTNEYIQITSKGYYLNVPSEKYKDIPIETLNYLVRIFQTPVIRTYLFLGVMQHWAQTTYHRNYNFTKKDIIEHCGIKENHRQEYKTVDMILSALNKNELIKTREIIVEYNDNQAGNLQGYIKKIEIFYWTDKIKIDPTPEAPVVKTKEEITLPQPKPEEMPVIGISTGEALPYTPKQIEVVIPPPEIDPKRLPKRIR